MNTATDHLTDERAVELLALLVDYARDGIARGDAIEVPTLRVSELAGDIIGSLPRGTVLPVGTRDLLDPDTLTWR